MEVDHQYLKELMHGFLKAPHPSTDIKELEDLGLTDHEERFRFHLQLLNDQGFVVRDENGHGLGISVGADGVVQWSIVPIRLTAQGHQFADALQNREVWATIKRDFKTASIGALAIVSKQLLEAYLKKKVNSIVNE